MDIPPPKTKASVSGSGATRDERFLSLKNSLQSEGKTKRKRLIHDYPENATEMALTGVSAVHPALVIDPQSKIVLLNKNRKHKVGILTGSGAGHEPFGSGFIGENMATCAIYGNTFASPPCQTVLTAIRNVAELNKGGVLVIILNYTGDVLNFGIAVEKARSRGINIESVVVGDDISLCDREVTSIAGKRGLIGVAFALKIAGALSTQGRVLREIALNVHAVNARVASIGVCFETCSLPNQPPLFNIPQDEMYIGLGVHGEGGSSIQKITRATAIVKILLNKLQKNLVLEAGDNVCVIVNNLGVSTTCEMYIVAGEVYTQLVNLGYNVLRIYCGAMLTSMDMNGFQISLLNVTKREEWIPLLDLETDAFSWPGSRLSFKRPDYKTHPVSFVLEEKIEEPPPNAMHLGVHGVALMRECLRAICSSLIEEEHKLNDLDRVAGDGDTGSTFTIYARCILSQLELLPLYNVGRVFLIMSRMAEQEMGGISGGLYSLMLLGAGRCSQDWVSAWVGSLDIVRKYSSARLGYRTMMDALIPACHVFAQTVKELGPGEYICALKLALDRAVKGCESTRQMVAKAGSASYVKPSIINNVDAGAYAVVVWLSAIYNVLSVPQNY